MSTALSSVRTDGVRFWRPNDIGALTPRGGSGRARRGPSPARLAPWPGQSRPRGDERRAALEHGAGDEHHEERRENNKGSLLHGEVPLLG